ncbi:MAG: hypothetical protein WDM77_13230 [Steroidobacteraceae bacterium]
MSSRVILLAVMAACLATAARGQIVPLAPDQDLVGEPGEAQVEGDDTLPDIARRYHLGFDEIVAANPGVDTWLPGTGTKVHLPTQHLLPTAPRTGIVVNLADGRLYYFHVDGNGSSVAEIDPDQHRRGGLEDALGRYHHRQKGEDADVVSAQVGT